MEDYLRIYSELYELDSACLRFFNLFGKNQVPESPYATAICSWLDAIHKGNPMRSDGDGSQSRDMCHIDNVLDACVKAAKHEGKLNAECFNIACGDSTKNSEILDYMLQRYRGSTYIQAPWRLGDVMHTLADITKARNVLGYEPVTKVWQGIEKTCDWYDLNYLQGKI
jgi:UDP-N-acetylglucosamine 4-epimerase